MGLKFICPKVISPFYSNRKYKRVPRKFKKKYKKIFSCKILTLEQKLWEVLGIRNPEYKQFLINELIKRDDAQEFKRNNSK